MTYQIVRSFRDERGRGDVIKTGLTLNEAQAHCRDPETASKTATSKDAQQLTAERGPWFDGYEKE